MSTNEQIIEAKFALEKGIIHVHFVYLFYLFILFPNFLFF